MLVVLSGFAVIARGRSPAVPAPSGRRKPSDINGRQDFLSPGLGAKMTESISPKSILHFRRFSRQSRTAWAGISAGLTEDDIATAHRYAEASAEALARYEWKGGGCVRSSIFT